MVWGLGLVGTALGLNTLAGSFYTRRQIEHSTAALQSEVASLTARHIQTYISRKIERLNDAATNLSLYPIGNDEQTILINLLLKNDQSFEEISVIDAEGREHLRISDRDVYFSGDLRSFRNVVGYETAIQGKNHISPVFTSDRAEPFLSVAVPLKSTPQKIVGAVVAKTNMQFLWDLMREEKFGLAGFMYLVNENGRLIAHKDPSLVLEHREVKNIPKVAEFLSNSSQNQVRGTRGRGFNGDEVLSSYAIVPDLGWAVIVEEPVEFALADLKKLKLFTNVLIVAGLLIGAVIIVFLSNRITRPILELRDGANIIEQGNLNHRVEINTDDEIGELGARFNQMAVALQNAQETLETRIELRTRELSALYDVTTTVNQTLDIETLLTDVIKKVTVRFHFDTTRIFLFDTQFQNLTLRGYYDANRAGPESVGSLGEGTGILGRVAESGEPASVEYPQQDCGDKVTGAESQASDVVWSQFLTALPIKTKTQVFGVAAFSSSESKELNEHDARLLKAICEHIAVAVERSRLFEEVKKRSEELQKANGVLKSEIVGRKRAQEEVLRQHRRISSLHEIGAAINSTLDQKLLLDALFAKVKALLPYSAVSVCWHNPDLGRLVAIAEWNLASEGPLRKIGSSEESSALQLSEALVKEEDSLVIEDADLDARSSLCDLLEQDGWKSFVGLPLSVQGKVLGALAFYLREPHQFSPEEVEFLATLASQVAIAIFNSVLYETSRNQAIDLAKAIHAKDEFLNVMSHELRTPLSVIGGYAQAMAVGVVGDMSAEQQKITEKIIVQSNELLRMINEILQVGSLQAGSVQAYHQNTNLRDLFSDLQNTFGALVKDSVVLHWDFPEHLPIVNMDGDKLKHVLQNLIHNALKFTEAGSVTLAAHCGEKGIQITVKDTGVGIEPEKLPIIFDMFRQVDSSKTRSHGGVGVGLFIVKKYVELLNGTIEVESVPGSGTTFVLRIPFDDGIQAAQTHSQDQVATFLS
jgi:signal transduction histidine kinase